MRDNWDLMIYIYIYIYIKSKTSYLISNNDSSPSIGVLQYIYIYIYIHLNVLWKIVYPKTENIDVCLTPNTLSRWISMHLSDTSSIVQYLKKHSCLISEFVKILMDNTKILEQKIANKDHRFLKPHSLEIKVPIAIKSIYNPVLMY